MKIKMCLVLCLGFMCLIGCQGAYVRDAKVGNKDDSGGTSIKETVKVQIKKAEPKVRKIEPVVKGTDRINTGETIKKDTYIMETVDKDGALSPKNILVEVPVKETEKEKNINDEKPVVYDETGVASFISDEYVGRMTASGVRYDRNKMTAAHPMLPFDTKILVTNLRNKRTVEVVIIDRFTPSNDRILNVSHGAAVELDLVESGIAKIGIKVISDLD
ncbi:MAG: septal ring lytic transglycosylase RlpA family protein [Candidatus Brocadiaceae bacterium]|nr:septal ring lytic transglycosylase RlpA family protein [Candidatus Brocadiaceae bacterium]